jgi:hypothetical protein
MAERLAPLPATQRPGFDPRSQPDLQFVWKRCLFYVTLRREYVLKHYNGDYR